MNFCVPTSQVTFESCDESRDRPELPVTDMCPPTEGNGIKMTTTQCSVTQSHSFDPKAYLHNLCWLCLYLSILSIVYCFFFLCSVNHQIVQVPSMESIEGTTVPQIQNFSLTPVYCSKGELLRRLVRGQDVTKVLVLWNVR